MRFDIQITMVSSAVMLSTCKMTIPRKRAYLIVFVIVLGLCTLSLHVSKTARSSITPYDEQTINCPLQLPKVSLDHKWRLSLLNEITQVTRKIRTAYTHVRGSKTSEALQEALLYLDNTLSLLDLQPECLYRRPLHRPESVCPEIFKKDIDVPFYEKGFEDEPCSYAKPIEDLVTILIIDDNIKTQVDMKRILDGIRDYNNKLPVVIGFCDNKDKIQQISTKSHQFVHCGQNITNGRILNKLLEQVTTKYTLIARDVVWFNSDARLERLIREIERQNVSAAGGATRTKEGHWNLGCHQTVLQNYTLVYKAGYDESLNDCLYCDFIDGPVLLKSEILKKMQFDETLQNEGLFEDFFLRLNEDGESIVCPDVMFFTETKQKSTEFKTWDGFARKWDLAKLRLSSGKLLEFPSPEKYDCWFRDSTISMSSWCQRELADSVEIALRECEKQDIRCELDGGTLLGALKMHTILPWERDADFLIPSDRFYEYELSKTSLLKNKYVLKADRYPKCCKNGRSDGGYYSLKGPHWRVEFLGQYALHSESNPSDFLKPTKVPLNGNWYYAPRNPGLHLRNRFGKNIYRHELHGTDLAGTDLWSKLGRRSFLPCKTKNPNCMARYKADGNMQFIEPIP